MKTRIAAILIVLFVLTACGVCRKCPKPVIEYRDSTVIEIHEHIIHDSIPYEVVKEVEKVITRDTASHLENRLALSDAIVSNGFLIHSLETKAQTIYVPTEITVADTTKVRVVTETVYETVEVEKKLTWWQKLRINAFWWLVIVGLVGWRREIVWLVKKIVGLF